MKLTLRRHRYALQAYRALNQALGRGIRNRDDWCALLLVDERHERARRDAQQMSQLQRNVSRWLRPHLRHCGSDFGRVMAQLDAFVLKNKKDT